MSGAEAEKQPKEDRWDAPNQQVVHSDESAPWDEGDGGTPPVEPSQLPAGAEAEPEASPDYESMTKGELIELAQARGISPANNDMTKAELIAALEAGP